MTTTNHTLVLVHGFAQTPASWDETVELLRAELGDRVQVLAPELPGHGETASGLGEPSVELARSTVREAVNAALHPVVLWGYSLGARVVLDFLINSPEQIAGAVIESGLPGIADPVARAERRSRDFALSKRIEAAPIDDFVAIWENIPALGGQTAEVLEKQRAVRRSHQPQAMAAALRGLGPAAYEPMWDSLHAIELPVLLMTGSEDAVYEQHADAMASLLPAAARASVVGAGHSVHIADPAAAVAAVAEFLDSL